MIKKVEYNSNKWFGKVPRDWNVYKLERLIEILTDYAANGSFEDLAKNIEYLDGEGYARLIRLTDLRVDLKNSGIYVDKKAYNYLKKSSLHGKEILIATIGAYAGLICEMPEIDFKATLGPNMMLIKFNPKICNQHYMFWLLQSKFVQEQLFIKSNNTCAQPKLNKDDIKNVLCILPPIQKQYVIADCLDNKCNNIDQIIEKLNIQIKKLKEYKHSVIYELVTKGLNPNVAMKESKIEWIGKIPEHWSISKVNNEFQSLDEHRKPVSATNRINTNAQYDYYGASGVIDKVNDYIFDDTLLLIGEDGANLITRNLPIVYIASGKFWVNNHAHVLKPLTKNNLYYMAYLLENTDLFKYITGSTQPKLTKSNLLTIPIIVPPYNEQLQIAKYLKDKCFKIDNLVEQKQCLIDKLMQYKQSLIYEYVTGKKGIK